MRNKIIDTVQRVFAANSIYTRGSDLERAFVRKFLPCLLGALFLIIACTKGSELRSWVFDKSLMSQVFQNYEALQKDSNSSKEKFESSLNLAKSIGSSIGTLATILGGVLVYWNIRLTQSRLITERFSKAIEQLGEKSIEIRLGSLYSLERIAKDSAYDYWTVFEVISAYICEQSPISSDETIKTDIQAALNIIGRRKVRAIRPATPHNIDIIKSNLKGAVLERYNFDFMNISLCVVDESILNNSSFRECSFFQTSMRNLSCTHVDFTQTVFIECDLEEASLRLGNFWNAVFMSTNLKGANFYGSNLELAVFDGSNISGARFLGVKNLTVDQVIEAINCDLAIYEEDFRKELFKKLGLSEQAEVTEQLE